MDTGIDQEILKNKLARLRQEINYHNYRYHVMDSPEISDYEFDQLMQELRGIEGDHPDWITPDSPTQRAGAAPADKFSKVKHPAPILSLGNAFSAEDVLAWYERILKLDDRVASTDYIVEPKIDGLTVVLHYRDGLFVQGATRGDGEIGEDITHNLRTIRGLPLRIPISADGPPPPAYLVVRGEAYISPRDFAALNRKLEEAGEKTYLNPRNTAAGSLRQLDPALTASRPLRLLTYSIVSYDGESQPPARTEAELLNTLRAYGFPIIQETYCPDLKATLLAYEDLVESRDYLEYEADGAVIKINDLAQIGRASCRERV